MAITVSTATSLGGRVEIGPGIRMQNLENALSVCGEG
jgi:hypothetical protein